VPVVADAFAVLAEPTRRRILEMLRGSERSVGELAEALAVSQPTTSKHLRVLRDAGFVSCQTAAQQRIYRLEPRPFEALDGWLEPYRRLWAAHLDALERHLDDQPDGKHEKDKKDDKPDGQLPDSQEER
jgi:DNA-binding transcriptional ArsR family regulator